MKAKSTEWEIQFNEEALMVDDLLSSGDMSLLASSKIRIALENKILKWSKYTEWLGLEHFIPSIREDLNEIQITILKTKYKENLKTFAHYKIWSEDLIPLELWDNQLIILGLSPSEKILKIPNSIFVLCPLNVFNAVIEYKKDDIETIKEHLEVAEEKKEISDFELLTGLDLNATQPVNLKFDPASLLATPPPPTPEGSAEITATKTGFTPNAEPTAKNGIWEVIEKNHQESSQLVRKSFDAYVVLKIVNNKTEIFNMDEDLKNENLEKALFEYDLTQDNPFKSVLTSGQTESFGLNQLHLSILDFKYACVTPLKVGPQTIGFLVGFKVTRLNAEDEKNLELVSNKNAA